MSVELEQVNGSGAHQLYTIREKENERERVSGLKGVINMC